jgi:four helix bundle protein
VSISLNIAEGWGRTHKGDYLHHLSMAKGSLAEVETLLIIALRLEYIDKEAGKRSWELAQEVGKMLTTMIANMRQPGARKPSTAPDQA